LSVIVFVACVLIAMGRRRNREPLVVPAALTDLLFTTAQLADVLRVIPHMTPADRATVLAVLVGEQLHRFPIELMVAVPVIGGAWLLDRRLRGEADREGSRVAASAPAGARCAQHPERGAVLVCARCGLFGCSECFGGRPECVRCVDRQR
jgi:hypothetical protein